MKVQDAKTHLSAMLAEVEAGAEFVIARGNVPVARLVPLTRGEQRRELGFVPVKLPDSFFDELPPEELEAWEG